MDGKTRPASVVELPAGLYGLHEEYRYYDLGREEGDLSVKFETWEEYARTEIFRCGKWMLILAIAGHAPTTVAIPVDSAVPLRLHDVLTCLRALPDMSLVRRLTLLDGTHARERWLNHITDSPSSHIFSGSLRTGEIILFRPALEGDLLAHLFREWNRLFKAAEPEAGNVFNLVGNLERFSLEIQPTSPAQRAEEEWAALGLRLLALASETGLAPRASRIHPIRASIWGIALAGRLARLRPEERSTGHARYEHLVDTIATDVRPRAIATLRSSAPSRSYETAERARRIFDFLNRNDSRGD